MGSDLDCSGWGYVESGLRVLPKPPSPIEIAEREALEKIADIVVAASTSFQRQKIKSITIHNKPYGRTYKIIKKMEKAGSLPRDGKITAWTLLDEKTKEQFKLEPCSKVNCSSVEHFKAALTNLGKQELAEAHEMLKHPIVGSLKELNRRYSGDRRELESAARLAHLVIGYDEHARKCTEQKNCIDENLKKAGLIEHMKNTLAATVEYVQPTNVDQAVASHHSASTTLVSQNAQRVSEATNQNQLAAQVEAVCNHASALISQNIQNEPETTSQNQPVVEEAVHNYTPPPEPAVRFSLDPNLQQPRNSSVALETDLIGNVTLGGRIVPARLEHSTLSLSAGSSNEGASGSITFTPSNPGQSIVSASYSEDGLTGGVHIPISDPGRTQISIQATFDDIEIGADINLHNLSRSRVRGSMIVPIYYVPVKFSGDFRITQPENAKFGIGLPTFGLDKIIPGMPKSFKIGSLNMKKIRRRVRSIGNKVAKKLGLGKRLFGKTKKDKLKRAMEKQKAIETFLSLQQSQQQLKAISEYSPPSLLEDPAIFNGIVELNDEIGNLLQEFSNFPTISEINVEEDPLPPFLDELTSLLEQVDAFVQGQESINETLQTTLEELNSQSERMNSFLEEFEEAIDTTALEIERVQTAFERNQNAMRELQRSNEELRANADNIINLINQVDPSVLQVVNQILQN